MILVNFSHPLTEKQLQQLKEFGIEPKKIVEIKTQLDLQKPLAPQVEELVNKTGLTPQEWQSEPLVIVLPGLAPAAGVLLAEIHGRAGHFPLILRLAPTELGTYEVAEIINLQKVRDKARQRR